MNTVLHGSETHLLDSLHNIRSAAHPRVSTAYACKRLDAFREQLEKRYVVDPGDAYQRH
jgi:hypothetical protein